MKKSKIIIIAIIGSFIFNLVSAQETENPLFPDTYPSPSSLTIENVAAFSDDLFSGTCNITLPIWTLEAKNFRLPISLNYVTNAKKVAEFSGEVALGWSLSAGGIISRVVHGLPDEKTDHGYLDTEYIVKENDNGPEVYYYGMKGEEDTEPDIFSYNVNGYTGKFVISQNMDEGYFIDGVFYTNNKIVYIPESNIQLKYIRNINYITKFILIAPDGVEYIFEQPEYSTVQLEGFQARTSITSWYLSMIKLPYTNEVIQFNYQTDNYTIHYPISESHTIWKDGDVTKCNDIRTRSFNYKNSFTEYVKPVLTDIYYNDRNTRIEFSYNYDRTDIPESPRLDTIIIKNGDIFLKYELFPIITDYHHFLEKIKKTGSNGQEISETSFEYYGTYLPDRNSNSIDFWGFFNEYDNESKIPYFNLNGILVGHAKKASTESAKTGLLKRIIYPTGGYKEFEYELHDFFGYDLNNLLYLPGVSGERKYYTVYYDSEITHFLVKSDQIIHADVFFADQDNGVYRARIEPSTGTPPYAPNYIFTSTSYNNEIVLYQGTYDIYLEPIMHHPTEPGNSHIFFYLKYPDPNEPERIGGGAGVRVSKIINYDGENYDSTFYEYKNDFGMSSGFLLSKPHILNFTKYHKYSNGLITGRCDCNYYELLSDNHYGEQTIQGSYVIYKEVTEYIGGRNDDKGLNGKIVHKFDFDPDFSFKNYYPHIPEFDLDVWHFGQPVKKTYLDVNNIAVKEEIFEYDEVLHPTYVYGIKGNFRIIDEFAMNHCPQEDNSHTMPPMFYDEFLYENWIGNWVLGENYGYKTGYKRLIEKKIVDYQEQSSVSKTTDYHYNADHLVIQEDILLDNYVTEIGEDPQMKIKCVRYIYPDQYTNLNMADALLAERIINKPIEEIQFTFKGSSIESNLTINNITDWKLNVFSGFPPIILREKYDIKYWDLVNNSSFNFDEYNASRISVLLDNSYSLRDITNYDLRGNPREVMQYGKAIESYCFDNNNYPIIKAVNIDYSSLESSVQASMPAGYTNLNDLNKNEEDWKVFSSTLRGHALLQNGLITTYTYNPLFGIISISDPKGLTTYYRYDAIGRLIKILNNEKYILQKYEYHFKEDE